MLSDRILRQVQRLLDDVEEHVARGEWGEARVILDRILVLDPENTDGIEYRAAADRASVRPDAAPTKQESTDSPGTDAISISSEVLAEEASPLRRATPEPDGGGTGAVEVETASAAERPAVETPAADAPAARVGWQAAAAAPAMWIVLGLCVALVGLLTNWASGESQWRYAEMQLRSWSDEFFDRSLINLRIGSESSGEFVTLSEDVTLATLLLLVAAVAATVWWRGDRPQLRWAVFGAGALLGALALLERQYITEQYDLLGAGLFFMLAGSVMFGLAALLPREEAMPAARRASVAPTTRATGVVEGPPTPAAVAAVEDERRTAAPVGLRRRFRQHRRALLIGGVMAGVSLVAVSLALGLQDDGDGSSFGSDTGGSLNIAPSRTPVAPLPTPVSAPIVVSPFVGDTTLFAALAQNGATWRVEGTRAEDGSIDSVDRAIFTRGAERLMYFFDGDFVTRFEAANTISGESAAFEIDYQDDQITVRGYVPAANPTPKTTATLTEEEIPGLRGLLDEIGATSARSSRARGNVPISLLEPQMVLVEVEVTDHMGFPVSDVTASWQLKIPPETFGCGGTTETDPEMRRITELVCEHPFWKSSSQRDGSMEAVGDGVFRQIVPLARPLPPSELRQVCAEAVDGWGGKSTAVALLIAGVVTYVDFQTLGATFGLRTIGVFVLSSAVPGVGAYLMAPSATDCLAEGDVREAALQIPWQIRTGILTGRRFPEAGQSQCRNANHPDDYWRSETREFLVGEGGALRVLEPLTIELADLVRVSAVVVGGPDPPEVGRTTVYQAEGKGGTGGGYTYFWEDGDWSGPTWEFTPTRPGRGEVDLMVISGTGTSCYFEAFDVVEPSEESERATDLKALALRVVREHYGGGEFDVEVHRGLEAGVFLPPGAPSGDERVDLVSGWDPSAGGDQGFVLVLFEDEDSAAGAVEQVELPVGGEIGRCTQSAASIGGASGVIVTCEPTTVGYGFTPYQKAVMVKGDVLIDVEFYVSRGDVVLRALIAGLP